MLVGGGGCSRVCNSASGGGGVGVVEFITVLVGGGGCSRVCNSASGGPGGGGVAEFVTVLVCLLQSDPVLGAPLFLKISLGKIKLLRSLTQRTCNAKVKNNCF